MLCKLAIEVGLNEAEVEDVLSGDRYADAVRADEHKARDFGIRGVPYFVINNNATVSGAQNEEVFTQILLKEQSRAAVGASNDDDDGACEDGFCEVQPQASLPRKY